MVSESVRQTARKAIHLGDGASVPFILRLFGAITLRVSGWKIDGQPSGEAKYVAIFAPHTSNWDFPLMMSVIFVSGVRARWFGKQELFRWPIGGILRWMGGMPIDRSARQNMVEHIASALQESDEMVVGVAPEGTRSHSDYWKSGFYHIANQAQVPIVPAYLDYKRKAGGFGPPIMPSGDIEADIKLIGKFYEGVTAKFPHEVGQIAIRPQLERETNT